MFQYTSIADYHQQLRRNETDCFSAVNHFLQKIQSQQSLNAFIEVFAEEAIAEAKRLDTKRSSGTPMGRLHGVVIAIKDVICFKEHKVSAASNMLKSYEAVYTASALQYLINEEAIIIGRCNCDEFAMGSSNEHSAWGPVLNSADISRVPGGSSGGSAVAVQANMCMISLGSDTGGSVRQPADFCGTIGFKPSYGHISRYGLIAYASSFDQIGVFGKNLRDVAMVSEIMHQPDEFDSTMEWRPQPSYANFVEEENGKYKLCYFQEMLEHPSLDPEIKNNIYGVIESLKKAGHEVEEMKFPLVDYIVPTYYLLTTAEASSNLSRYDGIRYGNKPTSEIELLDFYRSARSEGFGTEVKRRIMLGTFVLSAGYYGTYYSKAQKIRRLLMNHMNEVFSRYDGVLLPTSPTTAFKLNENQKDPVAMYLADIFTVLANLTGLPAISLPLFKHSNGLPFGIQVLCRQQNERTLFRISDELMKKEICPA